MDKKEIIKWLESLEHGWVVIDDGGLSLIELNDKGEETGAYLEVGGHTPEEEEEVN